MNFYQLNHEDQHRTLLAELLVFELLGKVMQKYPDQEFVQQLLDNDLFESIPFSDGQAFTAEGLKLLKNWEKGSRGNQVEIVLDELRVDYTRLFINNTGLKISPWESVYLTKERSLFQSNTLEVRNWYRRFGIQIENLYHEPDDHIGLELAFIAYLANLGLSALDKGDNHRVQELLDAKRQFLTEHPLKWVSIWVKQVQEYAHTDFYKGIALVTMGALLELANILEWKGATEIK